MYVSIYIYTHMIYCIISAMINSSMIILAVVAVVVVVVVVALSILL